MGKGMNMTILKVKDREYKVRFTYNAFCDTDLLDKTRELLGVFQSNNAETDADVSAMGKIKDLFVCVRELLFVGFRKDNPAESVQEVGDILDDYHEEATEEDKRGILDLFVILTNELMAEGFLSGLMQTVADANEKAVKTPQGHKKTSK